MTPYYEHAGVTIYHGDCREILPSLGECADVLVTDPPYGIRWRNPGPNKKRGGVTIIGDDVPFDPSHLIALGLPSVIWGANHFADKLPTSRGWIVWDKRVGDDQKTQGDAELAWTNTLGAVRIVRFPWNGGGTLSKENGSPEPYHPAQKPERVLARCCEIAGDGSVLDPYCGSGSTLLAAKNLGRGAVGIEIDERYCEIAARRLAQEVLFA